MIGIERNTLIMIDDVNPCDDRMILKRKFLYNTPENENAAFCS